jgi:hypothetical protein
MFIAYCNSFKDTEGVVFQFLKKELAKQMLASEEKVTSNNLRIRKEREELRLTMKTAHLNRANADLMAQRDSLQLELDNMRCGNTKVETPKAKAKSETQKRLRGDDDEEKVKLRTQLSLLQSKVDGMCRYKPNFETPKSSPKLKKQKKETVEENFDAEDWGSEEQELVAPPVQLKKRVKTLRIIGPSSSSSRESPREWSTQ